MKPSRAHVLRQRIRHTTWILLAIWASVSFAWVPFANDLNFIFFSWTFNFWMAAQGSVLVFLLLTIVNAVLINRWEKELERLEAPADAPAD